MLNRNSIYLDYSATTPVDPRVLEAMLPYFTEHFGNAASAIHSWGWKADLAAKKSRNEVSKLLGCHSNEVFFTSGSTESNNWVIFGIFNKLKSQNPSEPIHFITSNVEHSSILETMAAVEKLGAEVTYLEADRTGQVSPTALKQAIRPTTKLISIIWANNEIGTINDIETLGKIARDNKIYFHTDATQAIGKVHFDLQSLPIDLLSMSAHKIYGPKGIGALFIRSQNPHVSLTPLLFGGGQESGQRSGTLNIPNVVGFGKACSILLDNQLEETAKLLELRDLLWDELKTAIPSLELNGHPTSRLVSNLNFSNPYTRIDLALPFLQRVGFSTGAACGSGNQQGSHVLRAIGLSTDKVESSMRLTVGRFTEKADISEAVSLIKYALTKNQ